MGPNSNPSRITAAQWWLWGELFRLEPGSELGGFYAFKSGYHSSRNDNQQNWPDDYSIEDPEDLGGPADKSAAIDWTFPDAQAGNHETINKYSSRLLASGEDENDSRLDGWREFYGQADKQSDIEGWDYRYAGPVSSDSSHDWHIHLSEDRDKVEDYENKKKLLDVLTAGAWKEDSMADSKETQASNARSQAQATGVLTYKTKWAKDPDQDETHWEGTQVLETAEAVARIEAAVARIEAALASITPGGTITVSGGELTITGNVTGSLTLADQED